MNAKTQNTQTELEQVLQAMEKIIDDFEQQEIKKQQSKARIIRACMRPVLHMLAKVLGFGVTVLYMIVSSLALILLTMWVVTTIQSVAGMHHDSIESILLCVMAGGVAVYVFITETKKNTSKFNGYAEKMHSYIREV